MSIQKKSLISTLRTTKKANIAKDDFGMSPATASPVIKQGVTKQLVIKQSVVKQSVVKQAVLKS